MAVRVHDPSSGFVREDEIHPTMLAGATWSAESCDDQGACQEILYRIANVTRDDSTNTMPAHADNHDVWLYEVEYAEPAAATPLEWTPVCGEEGGELAGGVFVDGPWQPDGAREKG